MATTSNGTSWAPTQARRWPATNNAARERTISRLAVLKAAAEFGASRPDMKSTDVLTVADRWLRWVEQPDQKGGH